MKFMMMGIGVILIALAWLVGGLGSTVAMFLGVVIAVKESFFTGLAVFVFGPMVAGAAGLLIAATGSFFVGMGEKA